MVPKKLDMENKRPVNPDDTEDLYMDGEDVDRLPERHPDDVEVDMEEERERQQAAENPPGSPETPTPERKSEAA